MGNKAMSPASSLLHHPSLVASSSSTCLLLPSNSLSAERPLAHLSPKLRRFRALHTPRDQERSLVVRSAVDELVSIIDAPSLASLKLKLLNTVCGLNKGLAANEEDLRAADAAAKELETAGGVVDLSADVDKLQGRWKLVYSSAFSSRTLGGSRPGPPIGRLLPITLGQVFQRIDVISKDFDNIVDLELGAPWPLPPIQVTATLAHKFEITGSAKVKIVFEKTTVKTTGNLAQLPPLEIPQLPDSLRPSTNRGSGDFEVTYLDANTRITRGDSDELRVFVLA